METNAGQLQDERKENQVIKLFKKKSKKKKQWNNKNHDKSSEFLFFFYFLCYYVISIRILHVKRYSIIRIKYVIRERIILMYSLDKHIKIV